MDEDKECRGEFTHTEEHDRQCYLCKDWHGCLILTHDNKGEIT